MAALAASACRTVTEPCAFGEHHLPFQHDQPGAAGGVDGQRPVRAADGGRGGGRLHDHAGAAPRRTRPNVAGGQLELRVAALGPHLVHDEGGLAADADGRLVGEADAERADGPGAQRSSPRRSWAIQALRQMLSRENCSSSLPLASTIEPATGVGRGTGAAPCARTRDAGAASVQARIVSSRIRVTRTSTTPRCLGG